MLGFLNNLHLSTKLYGLIVGIVAVFSAAMITITFYDHGNLERERKDGLTSLTDTVLSTISTYYDRQQSGELTEADAKQLAAQAVNAIRYDGDGYFWINDLNAVMVMHPTDAKLNGTDVSGMRDPDGRQIFKEFISTVSQSGAGHVEYKWPKPGSANPVAKYSYVAGFAPWSWVVGTGVYADDLSGLFWRNAFTVIAIIVGVVLLASLGAYFVIASIVDPLCHLHLVIKAVAKDDLSVEISSDTRKDEIGSMARAVVVLKSAVAERLSLRSATEEQQRHDAERAEASAMLNREIATVVAATSAGDFSQRIQSRFSEPEHDTLAHAVNKLVETVDRGLGETGEVLSSLAHTDLTKRVTGTYHGAFDKLKSDTNAVADKLTEIVGQLRRTSRGLKTATAEILSGANDLSERTTKQAATIEETSAAMEQLAHTVVQNAERAEQASQKSRAMSETAEAGGAVMSQANEAMEKITHSSAKISNIIGMIDDIAFQTNLLALNASVEAARAGEAGKGFAVVAVEVRRLAQSAAEASSEVKALIEQSGEEVAGGSRLVANAAAKLADMLDAVKANNELMDGIARESREQASSIEEVNTAVRQMDEMTQHNAALVEETNAAIEQTEGQASELDRIVDVFRINPTAIATGRAA